MNFYHIECKYIFMVTTISFESFFVKLRRSYIKKRVYIEWTYLLHTFISAYACIKNSSTVLCIVLSFNFHSAERRGQTPPRPPTRRHHSKYICFYFYCASIGGGSYQTHPLQIFVSRNCISDASGNARFSYIFISFVEETLGSN